MQTSIFNADDDNDHSLVSSESYSLSTSLSNISARSLAQDEEPKLLKRTPYEDDTGCSLKVSRTISRKITNSEQILQKAAKSTSPLPPMGGGRNYPPPLVGPEDAYLVVYDGPDDPLCPLSWSKNRKLVNCFAVLVTPFAVQLGSAMYSQSIPTVMANFKVGHTVATLGTSLFVFGFASGPVIWGPLSELFGRKLILICSMFGYTCFSFAAATGQDIQTIMICRFFSGFTGGAPAVVAPAVTADLFHTADRGKAMTGFGFVLFAGPMLAPIFGGFAAKNPHLGWRWPMYFTGIASSVALLSAIFILEETNHQTLLLKRAEEIRRRTGNKAIHAAHEEVSLGIHEILWNNIARPLSMLFSEPILFLISLYNSFVYGILYLLLTEIPLIFSNNYHFERGVAELPYISLCIGTIIGCLLVVVFENRYVRLLKRNGKVRPEERLPGMMLGSFFFSVGLFWLGWTGDYPRKVHWIVPTVGMSFIGIGLVLIFLPCLTYIIDVYLYVSASALASNAFLRASFGAAFPLFARQLFLNMQIKWATTLLGCFSVVLIPVPILFYKYGANIRKRSKFAYNAVS
ncbi:uncharacterized protein PRCAT00001392001 [Priceomyces carsonii]|uniref:uncharacterized protein n=1 Tax=Priceomyces carsonii TaxID=28549 RepID=UPI002EDA840F|nr:unnamed protein product [Priceomyces carsonii]